VNLKDDVPDPNGWTKPYPKRPPSTQGGWPRLDGPGRIVAIEGLDGSGKSTVIASLKSRFGGVAMDSKLDVVLHSLLRAKWENSHYGVHAFLYGAVIAQLVVDLSQCLQDGELVWCDRYTWSFVVRCTLRGLGEQWAREAIAFAPKPIRTLVLDVDPNTAFDRVMARGQQPTYWECGADISPLEHSVRTDQDLAAVRAAFVSYQQRARNLLLAFAKVDPTCVVIDAGGSAETVAQVASSAAAQL
jgi:dTMP kinase